MRSLFLIPLLVGLMPAPLAAQPQVSCSGPAGGHFGAAAVCQRLSTQLAGRGGAIQLELTRDEAQMLAGRLIWQSGGRAVSGPLVDVTAQDRPLDARALDRLVQGLLAVSDLP